MSEKVIADFVANFTTTTFEDPTPVRGRIVLSPKRLVVVSEDSRTTIPLASIFDITIGYVPSELDQFFQDTMTIAYDGNAQQEVVIVEASSEEVKRFKTLLFKAKLNGTKVTLKHPARIGGRITDNEFEPAKLKITEGAVEFHSGPSPFTIDLTQVSFFEKEAREIDGTSRSVLSVRHTKNGESMTSEFAAGSERKMNILGRYLRLEYTELAKEAEQLDVSDEQMETMVAIYSGGDTSNLPGLLGEDSSYVTMILNSLHDAGLVVETSDGLSLTTQGRMLVSDRIENVNA